MLIQYVMLHLIVTWVRGSGIYHENTKIMVIPEAPADYFGFSVILNSNNIIVGAPKARNSGRNPVTSGAVFNCSLNNLYSKTASCSPIARNVRRLRPGVPDSFFRDGMWFGATMAAIAEEKFIMCAPRYVEPYKDRHLLAHGACLFRNSDKDVLLYPLSDSTRQAFLTDGRRPEYGDYGTHLNFFAYGQAGMSIKVSGNNTLMIGAPGLLQWTGGIIHYLYDKSSFYIIKDEISNPYFTKGLGPDEYFGYSVESGIFQRGGKTLYLGGAPRSMRGYGQVLIFEHQFHSREQQPLKVVAKLSGPQLGAYFGASLCAVDIDGDGASDLLVGAPNYVKRGGDLPYDQGAVFVYMSKQTRNSFNLELSGEVSGSEASGARFGTTIASLGDVDGDGFNDVAIGAPWENDGAGVVYIYRGSSRGLHSQYNQKLTDRGVSSFGISISNALDVDGNNCNDIAIGAAKSGLVYLYRCVPTVRVEASIKVQDAMDLPHNATGFSALFCVCADRQPRWIEVKAVFNTMIVVDPEENRAKISGETAGQITVTPGSEQCQEQTVEVKPTADLSKPISLKFILVPDEILKNDSRQFNMRAARVSEESVLHSEFLVQLTRDCGEDQICTPFLVMTLEPLENPYIPGSAERLGVKLTVKNIEEPAYGARVLIRLPLSPKRVPSSCSLEDLDMTCDVPAPLFRNEEVSWVIDMEYKQNEEMRLKVIAELHDQIYVVSNASDKSVKEVIIKVTPIAEFHSNGNPLPNDTIAVSRDKLNGAENVTFIHRYQVINLGPSDWSSLGVQITLPETADLSSTIEDCALNYSTGIMLCSWDLPVKDTRSINLPLRLDLAQHGELLQEVNVINITTILELDVGGENTTAEVMTTFVLDPAPPIWPIILGIVGGLVVLSAIMYVFYRYGFFSRRKRDELKLLQEQSETEMEPGTSGLALAGDISTRELISDESE